MLSPARQDAVARLLRFIGKETQSATGVCPRGPHNSRQRFPASRRRLIYFTRPFIALCALRSSFSFTIFAMRFALRARMGSGGGMTTG